MTKPVSGIAMGLITDGQKFAVLSDILGDEDVRDAAKAVLADGTEMEAWVYALAEAKRPRPARA